MKRPGPWLLLLVCWFASCAGVQLLHPQALLNWPGWWPGQLLACMGQLLAVALSVRLLRAHSALAQWLALLAWWVWPWQGVPQWLRVAPLEVLWQLAWVLWLSSLASRRLGGAWLATLLLGALQPSSLAGAAAGLALVGRGRHRWVAGLISALAMLVEFQPAGQEHLLWGGLALLVVVLSKDATTRTVAAYTLISAAKGGPTTSALLAWSVVWGVDRWQSFRPLVFALGTWILANSGETALNRRVIVPWQKLKISLTQGLSPHGLEWWARHIGPAYGLGDDDRACWEWLRIQPAGHALVSEAVGWDDPLVARVYSNLSGGRVLTRPSPWGLAGLRNTGRLAGTGLDWWIRRGTEQSQGSVYSAGRVAVWSNPEVNLPSMPALEFRLTDRGGPGAPLLVRVRSSGPVVVGEDLPRLVLQPGQNELMAPLHCDSLRSGLVFLPSQDMAESLAGVRLSCPRSSLPSHTTEVLDLRVDNRSAHLLNLRALSGLRARWIGEEWQPVVGVPLSLEAGQSGRVQFPLETSARIAREWLELEWQEPSGRCYPCARLRFDLWPMQQAEQYLNLGPLTAPGGAK